MTGSGKSVRRPLDLGLFRWRVLNRLSSYRSLALLLALLSEKNISRPFHKAKARRVVKATRKKASIEQILLVPHTELAKQFEGWLERLRAPPTTEVESSLDSEPEHAVEEASASDTPDLPSQSDTPATSVVKPFPALQHTQVLHRQSERPLDISTRFLITTPRYLAGILDTISVEDLHTIALDEADEMLKLPNRFHTHKDELKWHRHPPLLLNIMDTLLASSDQKRNQGAKVAQEKRIIAVSASANSVFRDYLVRRSGWLKAPTANSKKAEEREGRQFDWYDFSSEPLTAAEDAAGEEEIGELQRVGRNLMPRAQISHYVARLDRQGEIVSDASATSDIDADQTEAAADPNRYLVATATLFALKQIERGLLLIPSSQSLEATLSFLHSVAVPAVGIAEAFEASPQSSEPVLYVASVDAVRGLDIPGLEWIFITPHTRAHNDAKDYMHIAGRVGRLLDSQGTRGGGNVVSLVDAGDHRQYGKLQNVWQLLGIQGTTVHAEDVALLDLTEEEDTADDVQPNPTTSA